MRKLLLTVLLTIPLVLYPACQARATVSFTEFDTPDGLTAKYQYLGAGTGTAILTKDYPRHFYHYPRENYHLSAIALFIHCYDAVNQTTFTPNLTEITLTATESGKTYQGKIAKIAYQNPNPAFGATWQITFLTDENLAKEQWSEFVVESGVEDATRYKMWIASLDYEGQGLRGREYEDSPGNFRHGPISVFFTGQARIPQYRPVILIHGLGGHFNDWARGGNKYLVRQKIAQMMLDDESQFSYPPEWIENFSYGYVNPINTPPHYNYQGSIIDLAKELPPVVERLSKMSQDAGGDGLVDIVGYSLGGIIAREYLRQNPDGREKIGKIITIASPHQGADLLEIKDNILFWMGPAGYGVEEILTRALEPFSKPGQPLDTESMALKQLIPQSHFLRQLNESNAVPTDGFYTIASNIKASFSEDFLMFNLKLTTRDLGDLVVLPESALNIPLAGEKRTLFSDEVNLKTGAIRLEVEGLQLARGLKRSLDEDPAFRYWHLRLIRQEEVAEKIAEILRGEN